MLVFSLLAALIALKLPALDAQPLPYDLLLKNGRIVDGTGSPWFRGDVAIRGDTIAAIAPAIDGAGRARRSTSRGSVIAPGFIDIHTHARRGIIEVPTAANYVAAGRDDGDGGPGRIVAAAAGAVPRRSSRRCRSRSTSAASSARARCAAPSSATSTARRRPTRSRRWQALVEQGMKDGAFGLSTGLFYVPGTFTPTDEVIELAKVAGRFGGIHESHQRDDAAKVLDSVNETIAIGEKGGLPTQISHAKVIGTANWGRSVDMLRAGRRGARPRRRRHDRSVSRTPRRAPASRRR